MTNPDPQLTNPEAALGGADAVEKTTAVVGKGTDPAAQAGGGSSAHPAAGTGPNYVAWGVGAVVVVVLVAYLIGLAG